MKLGTAQIERNPDVEKGDHALSRQSYCTCENVKAILYLVLNVASATCIVFANKTVFSVLGFQFVYTLTLLHVLTTLGGMHLFAILGLYEPKKLPFRPLLSLSAAFVGYIVFWNLALKVNTVGFYQLSKICITPAVLVFDAFISKRVPPKHEIAAVGVLCMGVTLATIADGSVSTSLIGLVVAVAAIAFTAVYQVFVGSKQKELEVGSMALMAGYTPIATILLAVLVPIFEPVGISSQSRDTLIGFQYTPKAIAAIALTCLLGLAVSLSTFLVIGATSSVTYNVVGHVKTVIVLSGGCLLFGDMMSPKRFTGVSLAMAGIIWYSFLKVKAHAGPASSMQQKGQAVRPKSAAGPQKLSATSAAVPVITLPTLTKLQSKSHLSLDKLDAV